MGEPQAPAPLKPMATTKSYRRRPQAGDGETTSLPPPTRITPSFLNAQFTNPTPSTTPSQLPSGGGGGTLGATPFADGLPTPENIVHELDNEYKVLETLQQKITLELHRLQVDEMLLKQRIQGQRELDRFNAPPGSFTAALVQEGIPDVNGDEEEEEERVNSTREAGGQLSGEKIATTM
eukprot:TRINITY_DN34222_c0_g1_i1.p1 TRINITY_DN34222_c0_g1~~TRINITY_DN34222_c0_g1_i1.p1  ORF type:complete len:186 (+),score=48.43 TRINITY_DN34222_c0_g1_i1:23-559(+)